VLSSRNYNARVGLALVCPITSTVKGYPFEVLLPEGGRVRGAVLADQVKSVDWRARRAQRLAALPSPLIEQVIARIELLLRG
jgi:mRNA interferase MazF